MGTVQNYNTEVDDFMSLIYSGNSVFIDLLLMAFSEGKLWSHKAITGYIKKIAYLCVVLVANTLDIVFQLDGILVNGSVIFLILSEATSIIENAAILGVPIPDQITKRLNIFSKDNNATK